MILTFTTRKVSNTSLLDEEGNVMYQTHTTFKSPWRMTSIYRGPIKPEDTDHETQISRLEADEDEESIQISDPKEIARIHWHLFNKSRIVYGMEIVDVGKIFHRAGSLKMSFTFTAPDGKSYIWDLGIFGTHAGVLRLNDNSETVIAKLHRKRFSLTSKKRLEIISTDVLDWLDFLVVTFVYSEKVRADREQAAEKRVY